MQSMILAHGKTKKMVSDCGNCHEVKFPKNGLICAWDGGRMEKPTPVGWSGGLFWLGSEGRGLAGVFRPQQ